MLKKKPIDGNVRPLEIGFDPALLGVKSRKIGNIDPTVVDWAFFRYVGRFSGGQYATEG